MSQTQTHTDSLDERDPDQKAPKTKSRRPGNTAFRQQRLKAWQPILTPKTVLPLFFIVGAIFAPIGGLLLYANSRVQEIVIDYTDCRKSAPNGTDFVPMPKDLVKTSFTGLGKDCPKVVDPQWKGNESTRLYSRDTVEVPTHLCSVRFSIPSNLKRPVLLYYRLTNFYQNHRRYVKSLDSDQLKGEAVAQKDTGTCDPLRKAPNNKTYYPCGLIANSVFNDSFEDPVQLNLHEDQRQKYPNAPNLTYVMSNKSIAWDSDRDNLYKPTKYKVEDIAPPPNWHLRYPDGYTNENLPNLQEDEAFQVWMRTAGLPSFSKLAKRNNDEDMLCSSYQLDIWDNFPVDIFGGTKSVVISTRTVMGGKNPFLGIAYIAVGGICLVLGALFLATHLIKPRKLGDHTYLTWNNDQPSTATATGVSRPGNDAA